MASSIFKDMEAGVPIEALKEVGTCDDTGTRISFRPDLSIFTDITDFDFEEVDTRVGETAFLNAGLKITITDERDENNIHQSTCMKEVFPNM